MANRSRAREICSRLFSSIEAPKTELIYNSDYAFLVAVVLSAQTTDVQVNKVTASLFNKCHTIDDILALGELGLQHEIHSIGFYKNKSKNIIALSKILKEKFGSKVPSTREELESLPGVGRKTANVVLNTLFDKSSIAVDTHVLRVSKILGLSNNSDPLNVEEDLEKVIPTEFKKNISNLLVLHGRYVCKAKKPNCAACVLRDLCHNSKL